MNKHHISKRCVDVEIICKWFLDANNWIEAERQKRIHSNRNSSAGCLMIIFSIVGMWGNGLYVMGYEEVVHIVHIILALPPDRHAISNTFWHPTGQNRMSSKKNNGRHCVPQHLSMFNFSLLSIWQQHKMPTWTENLDKNYQVFLFNENQKTEPKQQQQQQTVRHIHTSPEVC